MLGKTDKNPQLNIGEIPLVHFINREHALCRFSGRINWEKVEKEFAGYYSPKGAPSIPMRIMIGLILLKRMYCFSDKSAIEQWLENPYWQQFCGEIYFQHKPPLYHSDFRHFKRRIGPDGEKKIALLGEDVFGHSYTRGYSRFERKHRDGEPKNAIARMFSSFGNLLPEILSR